MKSVHDVTALMHSHLSSPNVYERLQQIARFGNAFEGWLKWELVLALQQRLPNEVGVVERIGVEWRYHRALPTNEDRDAVDSKLIDLWFGQHSTAYVELKVAFANQNRNKQWASWISDFTRLQQLVLADATDVAGYASVMIAVGFEDEPWRSACENITKADPAVRVAHAPLERSVPSLRFCSIARELAPIR
jgi:hypothetical protein